MNPRQSKMMHVVGVVYDNVNAALWASLVAFLIYFVTVIAPGIPAARARFEQQRNAAIAAESKYYCEKWGMRAGEPAYRTCAADLQTIRANVMQRVDEDAL